MGIGLSFTWARFEHHGSLYTPCKAQGAERKTRDESLCSKYSSEREKQMQELSSLALEPQEGVCHVLPSAVRPEQSQPGSEAGACKGIAGKKVHFRLGFLPFSGRLNTTGTAA